MCGNVAQEELVSSSTLVKKSLAILHKTSWCQLLTANPAENLVKTIVEY